jgi:nucleotide-binding universal stress UspA family protein
MELARPPPSALRQCPCGGHPLLGLRRASIARCASWRPSEWAPPGRSTPRRGRRLEIVDSSRLLRCGLIAVGTGGRGRLGSALLGSAARNVIHRADRSVLVAPLSCTVPSAFSRILVAVDGSLCSERAVEVAAEAAEAAGAEVLVLHVLLRRGRRGFATTATVSARGQMRQRLRPPSSRGWSARSPPEA